MRALVAESVLGGTALGVGTALLMTHYGFSPAFAIAGAHAAFWAVFAPILLVWTRYHGKELSLRRVFAAAVAAIVLVWAASALLGRST